MCYETGMKLGKISKKQYERLSYDFFDVVEQMSITSLKIGLEFGSKHGSKEITDKSIREIAKEAYPYFRRMATQDLTEWLVAAFHLINTPKHELQEKVI